MPLDPAIRDKLLAASREAAAAFVEDLAHIRALVNNSNRERGQVRLLSNVLRRILIDNGGDLTDIAAPRIGRYTLSAPDNQPIYDAAGARPYAFFGSAGANLFGVWMRAVIVEEGGMPRPLQQFDPERTIRLSLDNFLSQHVLGLQGQWVPRRDAIKYMANVAGGVHSGSARDAVEVLLARIRKSAAYSLVGEAAGFAFNLDALFPQEPPFRYEPDKLDPVLAEVLAAAHFLSVSPDVKRLEDEVRREFSGS